MVTTVSSESATVRTADLEQRIQGLEARLDAIVKQNRMLKLALAGTEDEFQTWNPDNMVCIHSRLQALEETVAEHEDRFQMFVVEDGDKAGPDERAMHLRQVLLNEAQNNDDGVSVLTRDSARATLGGGLHKASVLDAMRRAANGDEAKIDGASDLTPIDAISFAVGGNVIRKEGAEQSAVRMDLDDLTAPEARQILTTGETSKRGKE